MITHKKDTTTNTDTELDGTALTEEETESCLFSTPNVDNQNKVNNNKEELNSLILYSMFLSFKNKSISVNFSSISLIEWLIFGWKLREKKRCQHGG